MHRALPFPNRIVLGLGVLALLGTAAATTTLATRSSSAQSLPGNSAVCAAEAADTAPESVAGPDTDTIDLQCGDQFAPDGTATSDRQEASEAAGTDSDTTQEGDQTSPDAPAPKI